ncbi:MAG: ATP-binding protein [Paludibacteraceae bacterium]|nr:ATP-binding protein [Paludibacteraceae bacterium]
MIVRTTYFNQLLQLRDQDLIKVVTGIRRCGKSTLLQAFKQHLLMDGVTADAICLLNFEQRENAHFQSWEEVYDYIIAKLSDTTKRYVFLDEVQLIPQFEKLVDALYVKKDIDLYITGSNAYLLSSELSTMLSGRYIAINLHPFSFAEYVAAFPEVADMGRLFRQYMNGSCFPESVTLSKVAPEQENIYLKSLYDTVVVKDIVQRQKLRKFDTLQRVLNFVFDSVGSVVSPNNIADTLRRSTQEPLSHNTILKYLRYFSESYLIYPVRLYNIKGKRLLESNYKYYVVDLGMKNILHTNAPSMDLGHKLENVVYFELLRRGGNVYAGRTDNGEVDFIVQYHDGTRAYYQVAYTANDEKTLKRELSSLRNIRDSHPKYLLTLDFDTSNIEGIQRVNVIDWLLQQ